MQAAAHPSLNASPEALLGLCEAEMVERVMALGGEAFRGRQLFAAVFKQRARSWASVAVLPQKLRDALAAELSLSWPKVEAVQTAADGVRKYLFRAADGGRFESVYIPEVARSRRTNTLCISSQTGCAVGCKFCFTASLRRHRNLTPAEIVGQVVAVRDEVKNLGPEDDVTNVVFMGMGEPLLNYDGVVKAARLLMAGLGLSSRRITISTAGIVPRLKTLGHDLPTQLAISLNASCDAVRSAIMPINKKWPLAELVAALRAYPLAPRRRITVEYVLLEGVNDSAADARRLADLLASIPVKVNLLPLNAHGRTEFRPPPEARVLAFQHELRRRGLNTLWRRPRGQDIAAACGQLGDGVAQAQAQAQV